MLIAITNKVGENGNVFMNTFNNKTFVGYFFTVDPCDPNPFGPCQNGGLCIARSGTDFTCICPPDGEYEQPLCKGIDRSTF